MTIHDKSAYCTLDRIVQQLELVDEAAFTTTTQANTRIDAQSTNVRNTLKDFIYEVSDDLYNLKFRDFVPRVQELTVYAYDPQWCWYQVRGGYIFRLNSIPNMDLLAIDSITLDGTVINSSYYRLDTSLGYPAQAIIFDSDNVTLPVTRSFSTSLVITGTWGYHENPSNMWVSSGDSVQDGSGINASVTSITVTDATNFETYQYIKIDDEFLFITSLDADTNVLTVERGVNGSTAATHTNGTAISTYNQTPSVSKDVARMVIREFALRNGLNIVLLAESVADVNVGQFLLKIPERWTVSGL